MPRRHTLKRERHEKRISDRQAETVHRMPGSSLRRAAMPSPNEAQSDDSQNSRNLDPTAVQDRLAEDRDCAACSRQCTAECQQSEATVVLEKVTEPLAENN